MDPITPVLIAAVPYLADKVGGHMIKDAYDQFKEWLKVHLGQEHEATYALGSLEKRPTSEGHKMVLEEALANSGLILDAEGEQLLTALRKALPDATVSIHNTQINVNHVSGGQVAGTIHNHDRDGSR
ncbi:MAG: hypothetical protein HQL56_14980 [Magnetococcales bacterium]|nr:hypothetical protein [Magnetococcales bacterium]